MPLTAQGISDRENYGDLSKLPVGLLLEYVVQRHKARRAGKHDDLRIGNEDGLHSWAIPKGMPKPGEKVLAVHQPIHDYSYRDFEGDIPENEYGAGTVEMADRGKAMVLKNEPDKINFTTAHRKNQEFFTLQFS